MAEKQAATIWEGKNQQVSKGLSPETQPPGVGQEGSALRAALLPLTLVFSLETGLWGQAPT